MIVFFIFKIFFLFLMIFFTAVNAVRIYARNNIPPGNFLFWTVGVVGFITFQWLV